MAKRRQAPTVGVLGPVETDKHGTIRIGEAPERSRLQSLADLWLTVPGNPDINPFEERELVPARDADAYRAKRAAETKRAIKAGRARAELRRSEDETRTGPDGFTRAELRAFVERRLRSDPAARAESLARDFIEMRRIVSSREVVKRIAARIRRLF